jgi:4-hydroxybenzoate polyprenyltransferase
VARVSAGGGTAARPGWPGRLRSYWLLVRADRPIGIYLLLWPALWALWVAAGGVPPLWTLLVFVLGTALMRSAGCAINDLADRDFDGQVQRTAQRPLAVGMVTPREAFAVFVVLSLVAFALVLTLNARTVAHSFVAVALAAFYPFTKRYTHLPQLILGVAFGWAVPMAFTALQDQIPPVAWVLFAATVVWALIYDTMYAMVDREDDLRVGIKSTAILFGRHDRLAIALLQLLMLALLSQAGAMAGRGLPFALGLAAAALLFGYQQWLIRARERNACFRAFLNNHYVGMVIFFGLLADYAIETGW